MDSLLPMRRILEDALKADAQDAELEESGAEASTDTQSIDSAVQALNAFRQDVLLLPLLDSRCPADVLKTPAFYGHGDDDGRVPCKLGDELVKTLKGLHMSVEHQVYQGLGHWIQVPEEIHDMISVFTRNGAWPDQVGVDIRL